jgi:pSer/pThr/pTyr-binding forkhead associated (FHA) protein
MATLEVYDKFERRGTPVTLTGDEFSIGRLPGNDLVIDEDNTVSKFHAVLRRQKHRWTILDLNASNGTWLNGERIVQEMVLRDQSEITVGHTRLVYLNSAEELGPTTEVITPPPAITATEHKVLVELCRPVLSGSRFTPPTPVNEIAKRLYVTRAAVANHVSALYRKFDIDEGPQRLVRLAEATLNSGAVTLRDLRDDSEADEAGG